MTLLETEFTELPHHHLAQVRPQLLSLRRQICAGVLNGALDLFQFAIKTRQLGIAALERLQLSLRFLSERDHVRELRAVLALQALKQSDALIQFPQPRRIELQPVRVIG